MADVETYDGKFEFGHMMERDIDLFLLYSFALDSEFITIFTDKIDCELVKPEVTGVDISREEHRLGESDVTVYLRSGNRKHALLIEDKIGAEAQPDQCARYYKRGQLAVENGEYDDFSVFIFAPQKYIDYDLEAAKYEHKVSFEEVEYYLSGKTDAFSKLRLDEIRYVLYSPKSIYVSVPDENATSLWVAYQDYISNHYPNLDLCNTVGYKPKGGSWIEYRAPLNIRNAAKLIHKADRGQLDLQFFGLGEKVEELALMIRDQIDNFEDMGLEVVKAGKSASLRKDFGKEAAINFDLSFESQLDLIQEQVDWICKLNSIGARLNVREIEELYSDNQ